MSKLPKRFDNFNINYEIRNKKLYVNDSLFDDNYIKTYKLNFTISEKHDFIVLAYYLNKNYLSIAYFDEGSEIWRFIYREVSDQTFNDIRDIVIIDNTQNVSNLKEDTVLDQEGRVYLLAPRDAKIR